MGLARSGNGPGVYPQGENVERELSTAAACALAADQRESASISIRESQTASTGGSLRVAGNAAGIPFDTGSVLRGCCDRATHFLCIESYRVGTRFTTRSFGAGRRCGAHFRIVERRSPSCFCYFCRRAHGGVGTVNN